MSSQPKSLVLAAALSTFAVAAAHAQAVGVPGLSVSTSPGMETQSEAVSYADLDLSHAQGLKTLMGRIDAAAKDVCSPAPEHGEWKSAYQACIKSAVDAAVAEVSRSAQASQVAMNALRRPGH